MGIWAYRVIMAGVVLGLIWWNGEDELDPSFYYEACP